MTVIELDLELDSFVSFDGGSFRKSSPKFRRCVGRFACWKAGLSENQLLDPPCNGGFDGSSHSALPIVGFDVERELVALRSRHQNSRPVANEFFRSFHEDDVPSVVKADFHLKRSMGFFGLSTAVSCAVYEPLV